MKAFILLNAIFVLAFTNGDTEFFKKDYISKRMAIKVLNNAKSALMDISPNILGGTEAAPHSHPWTVALYIIGRFNCAGVLISNQWVLTAAHCLPGGASVTVQLGIHNRVANEPTERLFTSGNTVYIHDRVVNDQFSYDIGLIRLAEPVEFSEAIQPINLPSPNDDDIGGGVSLTISGWGTQQLFSNGISDVLMEMNVKTILNSECQKTYGNIITNNVLCSHGGNGSCSGDGGGPLTYSSGNETVLRGLISYLPTAGCNSTYPHLFTRVKYHLQWIKEISGI